MNASDASNPHSKRIRYQSLFNSHLRFLQIPSDQCKKSSSNKKKPNQTNIFLLEKKKKKMSAIK